MTDLTVTSFRRRETRDSAGSGLRTASAVIAVCFLVHALNGLLLERLFLDLDDYRDYADIAKLRDALDSPFWIASGACHLVTAAVVVWFGVSLARLAAEDRPTLAQAVRVVSGVASAGYLLLAVTLLQAARSTSLLAEENPEQADAVYGALSVLNVAADGVAVAALGSLVLLASLWGRGEGWPRWLVRFSWLTAALGVLQAIVYLPLFLLAGLVWFAVVSRRA